MEHRARLWARRGDGLGAWQTTNHYTKPALIVDFRKGLYASTTVIFLFLRPLMCKNFHLRKCQSGGELGQLLFIRTSPSAAVVRPPLTVSCPPLTCRSLSPAHCSLPSTLRPYLLSFFSGDKTRHQYIEMERFGECFLGDGIWSPSWCSLHWWRLSYLSVTTARPLPSASIYWVAGFANVAGPPICQPIWFVFSEACGEMLDKMYRMTQIKRDGLYYLAVGRPGDVTVLAWLRLQSGTEY